MNAAEPARRRRRTHWLLVLGSPCCCVGAEQPPSFLPWFSSPSFRNLQEQLSSNLTPTIPAITSGRNGESPCSDYAVDGNFLDKEEDIYGSSGVEDDAESQMMEKHLKQEQQQNEERSLHVVPLFVRGAWQIIRDQVASALVTKGTIARAKDDHHQQQQRAAEEKQPLDDWQRLSLLFQNARRRIPDQVALALGTAVTSTQHEVDHDSSVDEDGDNLTGTNHTKAEDSSCQRGSPTEIAQSVSTTSSGDSTDKVGDDCHLQRQNFACHSSSWQQIDALANMWVQAAAWIVAWHSIGKIVSSRRNLVFEVCLCAHACEELL